MKSHRLSILYNAGMDANTDSYSYSRKQAWQAHAAALSGCPNGYVLVVGSHAFPLEITDALKKSFAALGYGSDACTFFVATTGTLEPDELFQVIEAIDPGVLVIVDSASMALVQSAYHAPIAQGALVQVFGRPAVAFQNMAQLMETDEGHQKIWAMLKKLPRLS